MSCEQLSHTLASAGYRRSFHDEAPGALLIPYDRTEGRIPYREIPASNLFEICLESVAAPQDWENMFDMRRKYSIDVYADQPVLGRLVRARAICALKSDVTSRPQNGLDKTQS